MHNHSLFKSKLFTTHDIEKIKSIFLKLKNKEINEIDANLLMQPILEEIFILAEKQSDKKSATLRTYNMILFNEIFENKKIAVLDTDEAKFIISEIVKMWNEQQPVRNEKIKLLEEREKQIEEEKRKQQELEKIERQRNQQLKNAEQAQKISRLEDELKKVSSHTDVIISIGNDHGQNSDNGKNIEGWDQDKRYSVDGSRKRLVINIDPGFRGYTETDEIKYFAIDFDNDLLKKIDNILTENILKDKSNQLILCEHRSPLEFNDVYHFIMNNINHYKEPGSDAGNLIFLAGYFAQEPLFWPTKESISHHTEQTMGDYSSILSDIREIAGGRYEPAFQEKGVLSYPEKGVLFLYPSVGSISRVEQLIESNNRPDKQESSNFRFK